MRLAKEPGSARSGFKDWYMQRLSAVVLALLLPLPVVILMLVYTGQVDQFGLLDMIDNLISRLLHTILIIA
ncbi:MAG: succinate dehydrogenase, hydrophobic membrane anchor protein, partial [Mariprofundus sp.]